MYVLVGESLLHKDNCVLCHERRNNKNNKNSENNVNERCYFWMGVKDFFTEKSKDEIERENNGFNFEKTLMVKMNIEIDEKYGNENLIDRLLKVKGIDNIRKFMKDNGVRIDDKLDDKLDDRLDNELDDELNRKNEKEDFWDFLENEGKSCEIYIRDKNNKDIVLIDLDVIKLDSVRVFEV